MMFYMWQNGMCITYNLIFKQMERFFIANDWKLTDEPSQADVIVIGACASFLPWFDLYREKIKSIIPLNKKLIIYGCLPNVNRKFFKETTPNADMVISPRVPERVEQIIGDPKVRWSELPPCSEFRMEDYLHFIPEKRYIAIQEGCNEKCTYCPHRIGGIGKEKSRCKEEIVKQVIRDEAEGAMIIVLEGNNAGSWGLDLKPQQTYADLIKNILEVTKKSEVYIGNLAPKWLSKYANSLVHPRITNIKIPIQTASDRLLNLVGRDADIMGIVPCLQVLRKGNKSLELRTEIIIGLPTETEKDLYDTLNFVSEHFDKVACYSYDFHPYTKLARMGLPFLDESVIERRMEIAKDFFGERSHIIAVFDERSRVYPIKSVDC